jgi:hypothetical protein
MDELYENLKAKYNGVSKEIIDCISLDITSYRRMLDKNTDIIKKSETEINRINSYEASYKQREFRLMASTAISAIVIVVSIMLICAMCLNDNIYVNYHNHIIIGTSLANVIAIPVFIFGLSDVLDYVNNKSKREASLKSFSDLLYNANINYEKLSTTIDILDMLKRKKESEYCAMLHKERSSNIETTDTFDNSTTNVCVNDYIEYTECLHELKQEKRRYEKEREELERLKYDIKNESERNKKYFVDEINRLQKDSERKVLTYAEQERERRKAEIWRKTLNKY